MTFLPQRIFWLNLFYSWESFYTSIICSLLPWSAYLLGLEPSILFEILSRLFQYSVFTSTLLSIMISPSYVAKPFQKFFLDYLSNLTVSFSQSSSFLFYHLVTFSISLKNPSNCSVFQSSSYMSMSLIHIKTDWCLTSYIVDLTSFPIYHCHIIISFTIYS